jgi:hypothetical protein
VYARFAQRANLAQVIVQLALIVIQHVQLAKAQPELIASVVVYQHISYKMAFAYNVQEAELEME